MAANSFGEGFATFDFDVGKQTDDKLEKALLLCIFFKYFMNLFTYLTIYFYLVQFTVYF